MLCIMANPQGFFCYQCQRNVFNENRVQSENKMVHILICMYYVLSLQYKCYCTDLHVLSHEHHISTLVIVR